MTSTEKPQRAAIYLRQSSDPSGQQFGVDRQEAEVRRYITGRGWEAIEPPFKDNDISAYSMKKPRPAFNDMLNRAEAGEFDVIVARHMDRLTRRLEEFATISRRCKDADVNIVTAADGVDTSTDGGRLVAGILAVVAQNEIERKTFRHLSANEQRARLGTGWGPKAFGYNGNHRDPELVPEEADAVRRAYADVVAGSTAHAVAMRWNRAGLRTNKGNEWRANSVKQLLLNPRYMGKRSYRGEILGDGNWPAIVDEDTWLAVKYILETRSADGPGRSARRYLLGSMMRCSECGGWLVSASKTTPSGNTRKVYRCKTTNCGAISRLIERIDPWVVNTILNRVAEKGWSLVFDSDPAKVEALHSEATALRQRLDSLGDAYADGLMTAGQVKTASDKLQSRLKETEETLGRLAKTSVLDTLLSSDDLWETWQDEMGLEQQRAVIKALTTGIEVRPLPRGGANEQLPLGANIKIHWRKPEQA